MYELLVEQGKRLETSWTLFQTQHNLFYLFILSSTWASREKGDLWSCNRGALHLGEGLRA